LQEYKIGNKYGRWSVVQMKNGKRENGRNGRGERKMMMMMMMIPYSSFPSTQPPPAEEEGAFAF
jgi:hypothetical protein